MRKTLLLILLLLPGLDIEAGTLQLGPRHKDESNGLQLQLPRKWEQVPTKFREVVLVGKWVAKRAKPGQYRPTLYAMRFLRPKGAPAGTTPAEAVQRGIPGAAGMMRDQPKNVWEWISRNLAPRLEIMDEDHDFKMSKSKTQRAHLRVYKGKGSGKGREFEKRQALVIAAQIEARVEAGAEPADYSYGILFITSMIEKDDMLSAAKRIVRRFRILKDDDEDEEGEADVDAGLFVDSEKKPELWRAARKKKLGNLKTWAALDTENYLIVYNKKVKRPLLKKIAKHIEAIREQVYEKLFPPSREIKAVSVVRVCKDIAEYHKYGGPPGSAGYWSRGDEELVVPAGMSDSLRVLYHEAFHQYIHYAVGDVAPHSWFNEGHGDYFAGHNYRGKKFKAAPFKWRTGIIATALSTKSYVPLRKFLKYTQREYYANPGLCYSQGWSFVYFLREIERRKIKKYEKYWGLLDRYFEGIKKNVKSVKEKAFEGLDPDPKKPDGDKKDEKPFDAGAEDKEGGKKPEPAAPPALPRLPGLDKPFPGENPEAGRGKEPNTGRKDTGETKSVAGPKITGVKSALDVAIDQVFGKLDIDQLEKDWVEWSK